jgi:hypothetical protein
MIQIARGALVTIPPMSQRTMNITLSNEPFSITLDVTESATTSTRTASEKSFTHLGLGTKLGDRPRRAALAAVPAVGGLGSRVSAFVSLGTPPDVKSPVARKFTVLASDAYSVEDAASVGLRYAAVSRDQGGGGVWFYTIVSNSTLPLEVVVTTETGKSLLCKAPSKASLGFCSAITKVSGWKVLTGLSV